MNAYEKADMDLKVIEICISAAAAANGLSKPKDAPYKREWFEALIDRANQIALDADQTATEEEFDELERLAAKRVGIGLPPPFHAAATPMEFVPAPDDRVSDSLGAWVDEANAQVIYFRDTLEDTKDVPAGSLCKVKSIGLVRLEAGNGCAGCVFSGLSPLCLANQCGYTERDDGISIIFKEVNDD